ncbi:MAG TPA: hypothetical protein VF518_15795 [Polyangia bacterium]
MCNPSSRRSYVRATARRSFCIGVASAALILWACNGGGSSLSAPQVDASPTIPAQVDTAPAPAAVVPPTGSKQPIGEDGKLDGALTGYAWVAGGSGTTWISPTPCDKQGCFKNTGGALCTQGSIAPLTCTSPSSCDWDTDWGAMIGWNPTPVEHQAWGATTTSAIVVNYTGGAGEDRLMAHLAGDPDSKTYCIENYVAGQVAAPANFVSECWTNTGTPLTNFSGVDTFGLQIISAQTPVDFNICVSSITLY